MIKVAILDDYQNVSQEFIDLKKLDSKYEIKIFSEPFKNEEETIKVIKVQRDEIRRTPAMGE